MRCHVNRLTFISLVCINNDLRQIIVALFLLATCGNEWEPTRKNKTQTSKKGCARLFAIQLSCIWAMMRWITAASKAECPEWMFPERGTDAQSEARMLSRHRRFDTVSPVGSDADCAACVRRGKAATIKNPKHTKQKTKTNQKKHTTKKRSPVWRSLAGWSIAH